MGLYIVWIILDPLRLPYLFGFTRWGDVLKAAVSSSGEALQYASDELQLAEISPWVWTTTWNGMGHPKSPILYIIIYIYIYCYVYYMYTCTYIYIYTLYYIHIYIFTYVYIHIYIHILLICARVLIHGNRNGSSFGGLRTQQGTTTASPRWYWSFVVGKPAPVIASFQVVLPLSCCLKTDWNPEFNKEHLQKPDGLFCYLRLTLWSPHFTWNSNVVRWHLHVASLHFHQTAPEKAA